MNIAKGKLIAVSSLAALGGVAAIALGSQPETSTVEAAASADPTKPKVKTEVIHRVKHVQAKATPASAGAVASAPASAPAPESVTAPAPAAEAPAEDSYDDGDDSYEDESADEADHAFEDSGGEDVDDD